MKRTVIGIFQDSKHAGEAVAELKSAGFANDISIVSKNPEDQDMETHEVKRDLGKEAIKGAAGGAAVGGTLGAIVALLAGAATFTIPGVGIAIAGPLAAAFTGAGMGAAGGSIVGALVDMGIPEDRAKQYEQYVSSGDVLVAVNVNEDKVEEAENIINKHYDMQANVQREMDYGVYAY